MENKLTEQIRIQPSNVDYDSRLGYADIYALFQNIAVDQSELFGYDQGVLTPKGLFWVTSRSKVRITERPSQGDTVALSTWPEKPERIRGRRNFTVEKNGIRIIEAVTEWAVIDRNKKKLYLLDDLYDPSFVFYPEKPLPEPFFRFISDFSGEPFAEYKVRSVDIDFEGHMNNVAYIRAMFGLFSRSELEKMDIKEIECHYKTSCYEGDRLLWYKKPAENGSEICARLEDQTDIFFARLQY